MLMIPLMKEGSEVLQPLVLYGKAGAGSHWDTWGVGGGMIEIGMPKGLFFWREWKV